MSSLSTSKPPKRRLNAEDRREQILAMAQRLFIQHGFEGVSMADLATALNTSRPTIYSYFPSTTQILDALLEKNLEHLPERIFSQIPKGQPVNIKLLLEALSQETEAIRLLNCGGGPLFQERRQAFLQAIGQKIKCQHFTELHETLLNQHPFLLPILIQLLINTTQLNATQQVSETLQIFIKGGVAALSTITEL